jgi:UDP-N-acetylglucosamine--N-acetylmuramyl-(pentapeptide) pyrophosphoryl-undecaprenol N-acetylglucosamine transferase
MTTTSERALELLPSDKTTVVGYPVRGDFWSVDRAGARATLGLPPHENVVLVTAGSLGARAINEAVWAQLPRLLEQAVVMHVTGRDDEQRAREHAAALTPEVRSRYIVHGYTPNLPAAMIAADLVVSRAGASSLGELPAASVPAILVPGEYEGWSQAPNAEYMRAEGAAVTLVNSNLDRLADTVLELLSDGERLHRMREASRALARPGAARDIALIVMEAAA